MKRITTLAALTAAFAISSASAQELATNGGFEAGNTSGWVSFPTANSTFTADGTDPFAGSFNGKVNNPDQGSAAVIKQANLAAGTVAPGDTLDISFQARGQYANGGLTFLEFFTELNGGGTSSSTILNGFAPILVTSSNQWQQFDFQVVVPNVDVSGGVTFQWTATTGAIAGSTAQLELDDVSIVRTAVPEPTSLALLGLGGLMAMRRRRA